MPTMTDLIAGSRIDGHRPWPRVVVGEDGWRFAAEQLSAGRWTLMGLWGDDGAVHTAVLDEGAIACADGKFTDTSRSACRTRGLGLISGSGAYSIRSAQAAMLRRRARPTPYGKTWANFAAFALSLLYAFGQFAAQILQQCHAGARVLDQDG